MLDNVAVPDELAGRQKVGLYPSDLTRQRSNSIFPAEFQGQWQAFWRVRVDPYVTRASYRILVGNYDPLPVDNLECHLMNVYGMGGHRCIVKFPDLRVAHSRVFRDWICPFFDQVVAGAIDDAQSHFDRHVQPFFGRQLGKDELPCVGVRGQGWDRRQFKELRLSAIVFVLADRYDAELHYLAG